METNVANGPDFELLKSAYAIIAGIPDDRINLDSIMRKRGESIGCGTIYCVAGWLGHHPQFQAMGLRTTRQNSLKLNEKTVPYQVAMSAIFNIHSNEAYQLFSYRGYVKEDNIHLSHKKNWLNRVIKYLGENNQLKRQLKAKAVSK